MTNPIDELLQAPKHQQRAAISRLASLTPGVLYYTDDIKDLDSTPDDGSRMGAPLHFLNAHGREDIPDGRTLEIEITGLSRRESNDTVQTKGDYKVRISRHDAIANVDTGTPVPGEDAIATLSPDQIRSALAEAMAVMEITVFTEPGFGSSDPDDRDETTAEDRSRMSGSDGAKMSNAASAGHYLCSVLSNAIEVGGGFNLAFIGLLHGGLAPTGWVIRIDRTG